MLVLLIKETPALISCILACSQLGIELKIALVARILGRWLRSSQDLLLTVMMMIFVPLPESRGLISSLAVHNTDY